MAREIKKYDVFKKAHHLVLQIYQVTKHFPPEERFGLASQMRRSAYSIPMNLIEGGSRESEAEFRHFVSISRGSSAEILYQLELSRELNYITQKDFQRLYSAYEDVGKMLTGLMVKPNAKGEKRRAKNTKVLH